MPQPAVVVTGLTVTYGTRSVVDGLSFTGPTGKVTALVGPNGAGKTTTVETCVGLRTAQSGTVMLLGDAAPQARHSSVGVMLQDGGLYPTARPLELLRHVGGLYESHEDPAELLAALGIDPATRTPIKRLSGGEQQRVKCALALVGRPSLVFLDEPTAGLDAEGRRTFHELVRGLTARGVTVILTTHLMDDVERLADQVVVVARGRDIHHGTVDSLVGDDTSIWIRPGTDSDLAGLRAMLPADSTLTEPRPGEYLISTSADQAQLGIVARWAETNGLPAGDLTIGRRRLEDVVQTLLAAQP